MPPLRPLPFLTPTQPTGGVPATGQPDDIQALLEMLQGLEQPLPPIVKPGVGQRIAAGLGDAMLAAANVLSRGAAPEGQAVARLKGEQAASAEKRERVAERNVSIKAQVGTALFQDALVRRRQHEADIRDAEAAAKKAQADADEAERKRQQEDREERRKFALDLIRTGRMQPEAFTDPDSPPPWPFLASQSNKPALIPPGEAEAALAAPNPPGMQKQSVTVGPGKEPTTTYAPIPKDKEKDKGELTQSDFLALLRTAKETGDDQLVQFADTPERTAMLTAAVKEAQIKLSTLEKPVQDVLAPNLAGRYFVERMKAMLRFPDGKDNDIFGPGSMRVGLTQGVERERFRKAADQLASAFLASRSGMAVSDKEFERLKSLLPKLNRFHLNNWQALIELDTYFNTNLSARTPTSDRAVEAVKVLEQRIRRNLTAAEEKGQPGDINTGLTLELEIP